jgi:hypothetical protein
MKYFKNLLFFASKRKINDLASESESNATQESYQNGANVFAPMDIKKLDYKKKQEIFKRLEEIKIKHSDWILRYKPNNDEWGKFDFTKQEKML